MGESDMAMVTAPLRPTLPDWAMTDQLRQDWPMLTGGGSTGSTSSLSGSSVGSDMMVRMGEDSDLWEVELEVGTFNPGGLKVSVGGDIVTISGSASSEAGGGHGSSTSSSSNRSFMKRFTLPAGCDPDKVNSRLSKEGKLKVFCPRKKWLTGPTEKALRF